MTLPRITKEVTEVLENALRCVEQGDPETGLVYADVLRQAGFKSAASRISAMAHAKQTQDDRQ